MIPAPIVSAMVWPTQTWSQRILPGPIQVHQIPAQQLQQQQQQLQQQSQTAANVCPTIVHRPIRIQESGAKPSMPQQGAAHKGPTPIPVYQRPGKLAPDYPQRRKNQGVDFNNLILLTKSAMKVRRNQIKGPRKGLAEAATAKPDVQVSRWLDKGSQPVTATV
jgi:hypothetical protein